MSLLRRFEREALCAVMEDCVDQLAVLGGIVPNYAEKPSAVDVVSARQSVSLVWLAESYDTIILFCGWDAKCILKC